MLSSVHEILVAGAAAVVVVSGVLSNFCDTTDAAPVLICGSDAAGAATLEAGSATTLEAVRSIANGSIGSCTEPEICFGFNGC